MMLFKNAVETCQFILKTQLSEGMTVIDATVGNGHDSLLIKTLIGCEGHLFGFDLDNRAIQTTEKKLKDSGFDQGVHLIKACHSKMSTYISESINAIVFNLGYLPGASKEFVTSSQTTVLAIQEGLKLLVKNGFMVLVIYSGHEEGAIESKAIEEWIRALNQNEFHVFQVTYPHQINHPPYLIYIERRV